MKRRELRIGAYATHGPPLRNFNLIAAGAGRRQFAAMFALEGLDHVALAVADVERAARWYIEVLGFERRHEGMWDGVPVFVGKGTGALALFPARAPGGAARPVGAGFLHLAFRATRPEFLAARRELETRGIALHFQDHEISHSIYFRDPDGHELEITTYEVA